MKLPNLVRSSMNTFQTSLSTLNQSMAHKSDLWFCHCRRWMDDISFLPVSLLHAGTIWLQLWLACPEHPHKLPCLSPPKTGHVSDGATSQVPTANIRAPESQSVYSVRVQDVAHPRRTFPSYVECPNRGSYTGNRADPRPKKPSKERGADARNGALRAICSPTSLPAQGPRGAHQR